MKRMRCFLCGLLLILPLAGCRTTTEIPPTTGGVSASPLYEVESTPPSDPFEAFLTGDFSVMVGYAEELTEWCFPDGSDWEYVLLDLDGDDVDEMFLRWADNSIVFHKEDGALTCWKQDTVEMTCYDYPLTDGTVVTQYDYGGGSGYNLRRYQSDGNTEQGDCLYVRHEPWNENDTRPFPGYELNGEAISKEEFDAYYQREIADKLVTDWTKLEFTK